MDSERDPESSGDADSLLRAVAATPERSPEVPPARIAHFRILGRLGAGGMGVVFRAEDEKLRRPVALKVLPRAVSDDDERRRRFLREARSAAAINHPNVATIYDVGEADGRVFIAMELVEGETPRAKLAAGALPVPEALRIGRAMATGLAKAHEQGIVHRDLKPENVMIARDGAVKILDFGLAKLRTEAVTPSELEHQSTESRVTEEGQILGTPSYMSPEQASGKAVDARSDVFSLGVTLYEMLTGVRPFGATTTAETVAAILRDEPEPPSRRSATVDVALEAVILRALRKKPEERFASAAEMLAVLDARAEGDAPGRRTAPAMVAVAIIAAVALVGGYLALRGSPAALPSAATSVPPASASSAPAPAVTRVVDLPPPRTSVPAAAREYALGMQALRDNTWGVAAAHFAKAVEADPAMPEGHLHLSFLMMAFGDTATRQSEFEKAAGLRAQLGERDRGLLEAMQPYLQAQVQDVPEADRRLRALAQRYPTDVEIWLWLSMVHYFTPESLAIAEHALTLDPGDAPSWEIKGDALVVLGKTDDAQLAFERCSAASIDGAECFAWMSFGDMVAGRCADFARDARKAADRAPFWLARVLQAMAANGASKEALEETVTQLVPNIPPVMGAEFQRLGLGARLAFVAGDFTRAAAMARKAAELLAADHSLRAVYWQQYQTTMQLLDIALETGDDLAVPRLAGDFLARSSAWPIEVVLGQGVDLSLYFARLTLPTVEPLPPGFEAKRREWIDRRIAMGAYRGSVWNYAYASPALTASEARAALDALTELGPPTAAPSLGGGGFSGRLGSPEADAGRVYLLAGRVDEAIEHLRRAVAQCDVFVSTIDHVRAELNLGRALEQKGDRTTACDAYGQVLAQWGHAKPRSVTAEAAVEGVRRLHCGK